MKYKIGVFGSAVKEGKTTERKAKSLAQSLSKYNIEIITGACSGVPYLVASNAHKKGIDVYGYSPVFNFAEQKKFTPNDDLLIYKNIYFVPKKFELSFDSGACKKYRNVISTANCDAGIIVAGRWGSMNEFTNLYDMGKVIGVLTGTGGIADELQKLDRKIKKKSKAKIFFNSSPKKLIENVINELKKRNK
ncbi:MAG: hypothetical protein ABH816_02915 [Candidatus Levyibacteriota bacterium]